MKNNYLGRLQKKYLGHYCLYAKFFINHTKHSYNSFHGDN